MQFGNWPLRSSEMIAFFVFLNSYGLMNLIFMFGRSLEGAVQVKILTENSPTGLLSSKIGQLSISLFIHNLWQQTICISYNLPTCNVLKNGKRGAGKNLLLAEAKVKQMKFLRSKEDVKSFPPIYWPLSGHWITFHKPLPSLLLYYIHYMIYSTTLLLYSTI